MQKSKSKSAAEHPSKIQREPILKDAEIALLDIPSINLYKIMMKQPDDSSFQFDEYYNIAFGQPGKCFLDISGIKGLLLHDWLDASVVTLFCM